MANKLVKNRSSLMAGAWKRASAALGPWLALTLLLVFTQAARAEELPPYDASITAMGVGQPTERIAPGGMLEPIPAPLTDDLALHCDAPITTESSGTWLRRGLWYADLEGVVMSRTWDSIGLVFAQEAVGNFLTQSHAIGESSPGAEGSARLSLGRFLFRDIKNRDHNAEMVVFGGGEWNEEFSLQASNPNGLFVPSGLTGAGAQVSFSGADEMDLIYSSRLTSFEWNYSVTERLRRDRMELLPSGQWVRRAAPGMTQEFLAGLRFVDIEENVDWSARDIVNGDVTNGDGTFLSRARNNLFGVQVGYGLSYESDRWNVTLGTKQGFMISDARVTRDFAVTGTTTPADFSTVGHENRLNYLIQASIISRYHVRPNLSLRFGWEVMMITNLALAPNQVLFNPSDHPISASAEGVYHGFTFGTEYYW